MKAARTRRYGSAEVMEVVDMPAPKIGPDEILVRVRASSVNPVDWKVRRGSLRLFSGWNPPKVLGADFAGEVERTGRNVEGYTVGEKVFGIVQALKGGAYAEKILNSSSIVPRTHRVNPCWSTAARVALVTSRSRWLRPSATASRASAARETWKSPSEWARITSSTIACSHRL